MAVTLIPLSPSEAVRYVRESMAFRADFIQWLIREVEADVRVKIFRAELNPLTCPARLKCSIAADASNRIRLGDSVTGAHQEIFSGEGSYELNKQSDCALVFVSQSNGEQWTINLKLRSSQHGQIVNFTDSGDDQGEPTKRIYFWRFKTFTPCKMVGWYDPGQLARTAIEVVISSIFGRHADYRLMEAVSSGDAPIFNYTRNWKLGEGERDEPDSGGMERKDLWLDYVGDVGDGWHSTYAVAHYLAQKELTLPDSEGKSACRTKRGEVLIFGGDQVYPIANRTEYRQRLVQPYETALCRTPSPHPHVYAIPGNHDWYDSLVSFSRLFFRKNWFGGWQTNQSRSYFALKLPGGWWVLAPDVQLDSDIDVPQVEYFQKVAKEIQKGDRVIICTAEPHWVYATQYGKNDANFNENNLAFLEKKIIGNKAKVAAFIAGDQHHYRRYQGPDGTQKITAGGGGAFLHPTHGEIPKELDGGFKLQQSFPEVAESRRLTARNLLFPFINPKFGMLTAFLYLLTAWAAKSAVGQYGLADTWPAMKMALAVSITSPGAVFWIVAMVGGFVLFTDTHSKWYKRIAGSVHGLSHLVATFFIGWLAGRIGYLLWYPGLPTSPEEFLNWPRQLILSLFTLLGFGWLVGSFIMGVYLFISLNWFGRHSNEAFSSLAIQDYKNFLRLRIEANGGLTIFPVRIRRVPRKWKRQSEHLAGPAYVSADSDATGPELLEPPIYFPPSEDSAEHLTVLSSSDRCLTAGE
ncbi:MAG: metallophosphoesterase [Pyrinomonadaceae bacterium]